MQVQPWPCIGQRLWFAILRVVFEWINTALVTCLFATERKMARAVGVVRAQAVIYHLLPYIVRGLSRFRRSSYKLTTRYVRKRRSIFGTRQ